MYIINFLYFDWIFMHYSVSANFQNVILHFFCVWYKVPKKLLNATKMWVTLHNFTSWQYCWLLCHFLQEPLKWKIHPCQEHSTQTAFTEHYCEIQPQKKKNQFRLYTSVNKFRALPYLKCQGIKIKFHVIKCMEEKILITSESKISDS